ncbi:MAG: pullulanase [Bacteroidetes bacterium]|nr:pullulanase [Bacteroidota bacterium]
MVQSFLEIDHDILNVIAERYGDNYFGCTIRGNHTTFRVFCPRSPYVEVEIFDSFEQESGDRKAMARNVAGVWELTVDEKLHGKYYGYRVVPPNDSRPSEGTDGLIADPYSRWVTVEHTYMQEGKTLILNEDEYDWEGDTFLSPVDQRDLVIYEAHLKDLTWQTSRVEKSLSWYQRFLKVGNNGGIEYLKSLGINALELLPLQKFSYLEPPYKSETAEGVHNTWNPYSLNYWGYMTSFFFMPESLYGLSKLPTPGAPYGRTPDAIKQLKNMVKGLHKAGISVIVDVVYNHTSQYDRNPLKFLDRDYYYRHDHYGNYTSESGCGNDLRTESPLARKLIIDSVLYWMKEFHIDGFRFDLANLIDRETLIRIREEARKVNPDVILIGEPWGGGYNPTGFSEIGWASWNDQIRNGVKGSDPVHDSGYIFGRWQQETSRLSLENFIRGTILHQPNGRYHRSSHSVNYLESHDGYTLADFIKIATNHENASKVFKSREELVTLEGNELNIARLAALYLMVSQGIVMIHAGQEYGRSKRIAETPVPEPEQGKLDHNSYNKDDATNYMDFSDVKRNEALFEYYCGLIRLRKSSPALRTSKPENIYFQSYDDALHISFTVNNDGTSDPYTYFVSMNSNGKVTQTAQLPEGEWELMVSETVASDAPISVISGIVKIPPYSGIVLRKLS